MMKSIYKYLSCMLFLFLSCKETTKKTSVTTIENKTDTIINSKLAIKQDQTNITYIREFDENIEPFVKKIQNKLYGFDRNIKISHQIIETNKWIDGYSFVIVFFDLFDNDENSENVEGFILCSLDKKKYHLIKIDTFYPEGRKANIESVFFSNADQDDSKELVILCSWIQRHKNTAEGKLYQTFIYDDYKPQTKVNKLVFLQEISDHFSIEFEGIQEGEESIAKFKSSFSIKNELKNLGF